MGKKSCLSARGQHLFPGISPHLSTRITVPRTLSSVAYIIYTRLAEGPDTHFPRWEPLLIPSTPSHSPPPFRTSAHAAPASFVPFSVVCAGPFPVPARVSGARGAIFVLGVIETFLLTRNEGDGEGSGGWPVSGFFYFSLFWFGFTCVNTVSSPAQPTLRWLLEKKMLFFIFYLLSFLLSLGWGAGAGTTNGWICG